MKKRVKRKFNFIKFLKFILFILIICLIINYLFSIKTKNIIILNTEYYSDEIIIETAKLEKYPEFLKIKKQDIKNRLLKLDLVEDVEIKKRLGFILELDIKEKKVLYVTRSTNKYKLSTYEDVDNNNEYQVPVLINFVPEDIEKEFTEKLSKIDKNILSLVSEIEYSTTDYDDERFVLYMNDGNQVYVTNNRVELLNKYVDIMKKISSDKKGILYLDNGNYFKIIEQ
ncbi:MAG: FtsQ-type POTRA domain-containing protein [Bacilli bacterium]|nr:FtsQ-type POTRA domain-containing protein [Bacilli bacterium]